MCLLSLEVGLLMARKAEISLGTADSGILLRPKVEKQSTGDNDSDC